MVVVIRLDLDRYELDVIERLVVDNVITMGDATESRAVREMSEYEILMWIRGVQRSREFSKVG